MGRVSEPIDFEAAGLLDGLDGDERADREALLKRLVDAGFELEELCDAAEDGRITVLQVERLLAGEPTFTPTQVAERSGVPLADLEDLWRSIGLAVPGPDDRVLSREDLEAAHRQRELLDSGLGPEETNELGRTIAVAMSQFAAASRQVLAAALIEPDDTETEISERIHARTVTLLPLVGPTLEYVYRLHLREQLRHAAFAAGTPRGQGGAGPAELVTVAFADLVGFTRLGEEMPPEELGSVTGRLEEVAREVSHGPVRLVKLIGDAAMLASADTVALLEATHELVEAMQAPDEEGFPLIRAGVARGAVLSRGGDYYGAPVNLASRITGIARPGSVLVSADVRSQAPDAFRYSRAGRKSLKGIKGSTELFRCRRLRTDDEADAGAESE